MLGNTGKTLEMDVTFQMFSDKLIRYVIVKVRNYINTWIEKFHNGIFLIVNLKYTNINYF